MSLSPKKLPRHLSKLRQNFDAIYYLVQDKFFQVFSSTENVQIWFPLVCIEVSFKFRRHSQILYFSYKVRTKRSTRNEIWSEQFRKKKSKSILKSTTLNDFWFPFFFFTKLPFLSPFQRVQWLKPNWVYGINV